MKLAVITNDAADHCSLADRRSQKRTMHQAGLTGRPDARNPRIHLHEATYP